ncbi:proteinase inhibitor I4 serpin [Maribacter arenosus]|uniref:Proteinase inhibitor I4 serpin n=2 Tax=Maribacter arenosus TaxID=1854708 RepID=A0ABR7VDE0_9FLAO|nr:proteinase inhibitor I4 serpin [Maribacter arenosus]
MCNRNHLIICLLAMNFYSCTDNDDSLSGRCALEPDPGDCEAAILRYFYDKEEQRCKEFIWGGCGGVVPFETIEDCMDCLSQ